MAVIIDEIVPNVNPPLTFAKKDGMIRLRPFGGTHVPTLSCGPRYELRHAHALELPVPGLLGRQLAAALAFAKSRFDAVVVLDDAVTGEQKPAAEMFEQKGRRWFLRADSMPGDLALKAIAVTDVSLLLETAPVRPEALAQVIEDADIPLAWNSADAFTFGDRRAHACYLHRRDGKVTVDGKALRVWRSLWTIPHKRGTTSPSVMAAVSLADRAFEDYVYDDEKMVVDALDAGNASTPRAQRREMRLELGFQQQLALEQVPVLTLGERLEQRMELAGILGLQRKLLSMTDEQVAAWVASDPSEEGQRRAMNVLVFVLAGKIRKARPDITWKDARAAARKAVFTPVPGT